MKIGIDARLLYETGVGRYIKNLIHELGRIDKNNHYILFVNQRGFDNFSLPNTRWQKRLVRVPWHSIREQFVMPKVLTKERLDLFHVPYFNVPIFYPGKLIVTIHDLTIARINTGKATKLPLPLYKLKRLGYLVVLLTGLRRAHTIVTVAQVTKNEIVNNYGIEANKIKVTYEGVEESFIVKKQKRLVDNEYFLYVGNAYPHKNIERLVEVAQKMGGNEKIVLVGKDDYFYKELKRRVQQMPVASRIIFFGEATDEELQNLYTYARALLFPSLMEGFGLPGLEAMKIGTPVLCSDIPIFREIYGDAALYFDPNSTESVLEGMEQVKNDTVRVMLVQKGKEQVKKYSWQKMAKETLAIYNT